MVERFDDGTRLTKEFIGLHYSEKGGHFWRGLYKRVLGIRGFSLAPPIRTETSWQMRRHMRRIPIDGRR